ncbi:MAG: thiosulfate oxidation carrier protein SoxY [Nisaea sp.]|jgi:sulfur-oxidizing protein SoxY|uniref:thiosulfate oxidation carrier protein SoxY n=1 Tax=Nisaea sp. TaxID=2024842 RepID=UPI001B2EE9EF|nr:thiosulfate oxidation carrier protein SoxY [Nisaea sp.]MBO6562715.1 thiosulfate oxidation carrier protein SoxY [Nisaea sp.]
MQMTRRDLFALAAGLAAAGLISLPADASTDAVEAAIKEFAGGMPETGGVDIGAPEIAENGNTVPIEVFADGAASIMILAAGNPNPGVGTFHFTEMSAESRASTRIRLAKTQDVVAVAKMADGSTKMARREVKVTIGGCGG